MKQKPEHRRCRPLRNYPLVEGVDYREASVAMDEAIDATATISAITINGRKITGPISLGTSVQFSFDWAIVSGNGPIQQINVGFVGGDTRCLASGFIIAKGQVAQP